MSKTIVEQFAVIIILFAWPSVRAQDRIFNYTYQSSVLGVGQREIEPWATFRWGRNKFYRAFDQRVEFELGIAKNLQTSFYLNTTASAAKMDSSIVTDHSMSFSNEWKFKISDPAADPVGFALYQEYTFAPTELEWESKLIFDRRIGKTTLALNLVGEMAWETHPRGVETDPEYRYEVDLGWSYTISQGWYLAAEARNAISGGKFVLFAGPTISYSRDNFWVNLTVLPQVKGIKGATKSGLVLDQYEKLETRLLFSYAF
jgi:hypothetical protein